MKQFLLNNKIYFETLTPIVILILTSLQILINRKQTDINKRLVELSFRRSLTLSHKAKILNVKNVGNVDLNLHQIIVNQNLTTQPHAMPIKIVAGNYVTLDMSTFENVVNGLNKLELSITDGEGLRYRFLGEFEFLNQEIKGTRTFDLLPEATSKLDRLWDSSESTFSILMITVALLLVIGMAALL